MNQVKYAFFNYENTYLRNRNFFHTFWCDIACIWSHILGCFICCRELAQNFSRSQVHYMRNRPLRHIFSIFAYIGQALLYYIVEFYKIVIIIKNNILLIVPLHSQMECSCGHGNEILASEKCE
jgi:hypothetical protein